MKYFAFLLLVSLTLLMSACQSEAELYTKERAIAAANRHLAEYAAQQHVPITKFKGPYLQESLGLDFPTYIVCYKHPVHFFCYDHWVGHLDTGSFIEGEQQTELMKWLEAQP